MRTVGAVKEGGWITFALSFVILCLGASAYSASLFDSLNSPDTCPSIDFVRAAKKNLTQKDSLSWYLNPVIHGRQRLGWQVYFPLIAYSLGIRISKDNHEIGSADFARAVHERQLQWGLKDAEPGVIDDKTLLAFIKLDFQAKRRLSSIQDEKQFASALPYFLNDQRDKSTTRIGARTFVAYKKMLAAARAAHVIKSGDSLLKVISGYRSQEYQDQVRKRNPSADTDELAEHSHHRSGRALDLYVGGSLVRPTDMSYSARLTESRSPVYRWLIQNAGKFGFVPYYAEPWHWEYVDD